MIELIMVFALGVLAAGLLALLILPAVNHRAERLAKRRVEALFPLSTGEIAAERDRLRAEFAVATRRLERDIETLRTAKAASDAEAGRRTYLIKEQEETIVARDAAIASLESDAADLRRDVESLEADLGATRQDLATTRETLAAREEELARLTDEQARTQAALDAKTIEAASLETRNLTLENDLDDTRATLQARTAELGAVRDALSQSTDLVERLNGHIAELSERLSTTEAIRDDQARRLEALQARESSLSKALTEATLAASRHANTLTSRDAEAAALRNTITELEGRLAASDDESEARLRAAGQETESLRAEKTTAEAALANARADRARLQQELAALKREGGGEAIKAENAALRARIEDVAAEIVRLVGQNQPRGEDNTPPLAKRQA